MRERIRGLGAGESGLALLAGMFVAATALSLQESIGVKSAATLAVVASVVALLVAVAVAWHNRIILDDDGVHVKSRVLPYAEIDRARRRSRTVEIEEDWGGKRYGTAEYVELTLSTGEVLDLIVRDPGALAKRILERKHEAEIVARQRASLLKRGDRSASAWIAELRSRNEPGGHYRSAPKDLTSLWNIVESVWQRADDRAAAAVALGHRASPRAQQRLLRIAEEAKSPELRIAIEQSVVEDDDEALAEAMDALAEDAVLQRRA